MSRATFQNAQTVGKATVSSVNFFIFRIQHSRMSQLEELSAHYFIHICEDDIPINIQHDQETCRDKAPSWGPVYQ
jgi:hypothetical protein